MEYPSLDLIKLMKSIRLEHSVSDVCYAVVKGQRLQQSTMVSFEVKMAWVISFPSVFTGTNNQPMNFLASGKELGFLK